MYDNSNIKFETSLIMLNLCDYIDACILARGTITVPNKAVAAITINNTNKKVILKNCAPLFECITGINNTKVDDTQKIDLIIPMCNLTEYSDAYSKTKGSL